MRKLFLLIIGLLIMFFACGAGENIPTSKFYVDNALTQKKDIIERATGVNQAFINTGTAGKCDTKEIYISTKAYARQMDVLVNAQTINIGIQNTIDREFRFIEWVDNNSATDCLLMEMRGGNRQIDIARWKLKRAVKYDPFSPITNTLACFLFQWVVQSSTT